MGTYYNQIITVNTENGLFEIEKINSIQRAEDHGALITLECPEGISDTILIVESFLRVLTYFKSQSWD